MNADTKRSLNTTSYVAFIMIFLLPVLTQILDCFQQGRRINYVLHSLLATVQIVGFILAVIAAVIALIIVAKEKNADKVLVAAAKRDSFWDEGDLKFQTRSICYKIQDAWCNGYATSLKDYVMPEFMLFFTKHLQENHEINNNGSIDIDETHIISCQDFEQNEKDKFIGYISGNMVFEQPGDDADQSAQSFSGIYHFIRHENKWLLWKMNHGVSFGQLLFITSKYEQ